MNEGCAKEESTRPLLRDLLDHFKGQLNEMEESAHSSKEKLLSINRAIGSVKPPKDINGPELKLPDPNSYVEEFQFLLKRMDALNEELRSNTAKLTLLVG